MSCVRESSPQSENVVSQRPGKIHKKINIFLKHFILLFFKTMEKKRLLFTEPKKRRFHPLRGLRRIFRRKAPASPEPNEVKSFDDVLEPSSLDTSRSRSTSQLIDEPFNCRRRYVCSIYYIQINATFLVYFVFCDALLTKNSNQLQEFTLHSVECQP